MLNETSDLKLQICNVDSVLCACVMCRSALIVNIATLLSEHGLRIRVSGACRAELT